MPLRSVLLLEPFHVPADMRGRDSKHLINKTTEFPVDFMTYAAGLIYAKTGYMATKFYSVPLGLAQISAILKSKGIGTSHEPFIIDAVKRPLNDAEIEKRIRNHDYSQVLMSVGSQDEALECIRYARIVKNINSNTPILIGGIFPTFYPEWFLKHQEINMVARGPAEDLISRYVERLGANHIEIPGLCSKGRDGSLFITPPAQAPELSRLPPMDLEGLHVDRYLKDNPFANILTSRGCPFSCPFCSHTAYWGKTVQFRNLENVRKELRTLEQHGCKAGYIIDSAFTLNPTHVRHFADLYQQERFTMRLAFETRADHFNREMATTCAAFYPALVWFGGESGSPEILSRLPGKRADMGKKHLHDMKDAVMNAKAAGIMSGASFIIGLPGETKRTIIETRDFIIDLLKRGLGIADVRNLQIFPGTDFFENRDTWGLQLEEAGIRLEKGDWKQAISHRTVSMSAQQLRDATGDVQREILRFYRSTRDYRRVMRILNLVQFIARHERIAKGFERLANR